MKSIFFLSLFLSPSVFAQEISCLKTTGIQHEEILACNETDSLKFASFGCSKQSEICFTGNSPEIVAKLNSDAFSGGDVCFTNASVIDSEHIKFSYGDLGDSCDHHVKKCE